MKLRIPKLLLCALMALYSPLTTFAIWNEDSPHYYHCDGGGMWNAYYEPVKKDVYDIRATDAHIEIIKSAGSPAVLEGSVILNGGGTSFGSGGNFWNLDKIYASSYKACIGFYGYTSCGEENYAKWHISGNMAIKSDTAVFFWNEAGGEYDAQSGWEIFKSDYRMPDTSDYIIRCGSVDESTVSRLKPYLIRDDYKDNIETGDYAGGSYVKLLDGYSFYAITGESGYSYIYLSEGGKPVIPPNAILVGENQTVVLGQDAATTPASGQVVYLQGGVADAGALSNDLLNNQLIQGSDGVLLTNGTQTMSLTGGGFVAYSVVPVQMANEM